MDTLFFILAIITMLFNIAYFSHNQKVWDFYKGKMRYLKYGILLMLTGFEAGYIFAAFHFSINNIHSTSSFIFSQILFWGAVFVMMSNALFFNLLKAQEKAYNERLRLIEQSQTDGLTKLLNKATFEQYAVKYLAENPDDVVSFLMIDLDNFKQINDIYGHAAGDEILEKTARFLEASVASHDAFVGRIGGDEFMILVKNLGEQALKELIKKMYLEFSISLNDYDVHYTGSIGGYSGQCRSNSFQDFYKRTDQLLYAEKARRKL